MAPIVQARLASASSPLRAVHVGGGERRAHLVEADAVAIERRRVELDAHAGERAAAHEHLAHALDLRELLLEDRGGGVVEPVGRDRVRGEREDQDRRVGRVDLPVVGVVRQVRRELAARGVDRRLHVARGCVDVPREIELEDDRGRAQVARRRHLLHARDAAELPLERHRHRRGHGLRARPGQRRLHLDGGELDLRQRCHRELAEGHPAGERKRGGEQRRADRPADEGRRDAGHGAMPPRRPRARRRRAAARGAGRADRRRGRRPVSCRG